MRYLFFLILLLPTCITLFARIWANLTGGPYVYVEKSGGLDEHSARGILTRPRRKRNSAQVGWSGAEPWVCARKRPASEGAEEWDQTGFRSKTFGTPRLIPAFNDDGQIALTRARSLSSAALSERAVH